MSFSWSASPSMVSPALLLDTSTASTSSPRTSTPRKKRKQARLINPASSFDLSSHNASPSTSQHNSFDGLLPSLDSPPPLAGGERQVSSSNSLSLDLSPPSRSATATPMGNGQSASGGEDRESTTPPASPPPLTTTDTIHTSAPVPPVTRPTAPSVVTTTPPPRSTPRWPLSLSRGKAGTTTSATPVTAMAGPSARLSSDDSMADMEEVELDDSLAALQHEAAAVMFKYGSISASQRPAGVGLGRPSPPTPASPEAATQETPPPSPPHTPAPNRLSALFSTPAGSHLVAQTPRSVLRRANTPATGNSVRFNNSVYFKVIERLPDFLDAPEHQSFEQMGDEGETDLGEEPEVKEEVPMISPPSSDEDSLEFEPTHKKHDSSADSNDLFDDEVIQNTETNSHTCHDLSFNRHEVGTEIIVTAEDRSGTEGGDWTWSPETQYAEVQPIRHFSPLAVPDQEDWPEASPNNSSEWVVPADLSFGNESLPKLGGASFSISQLVDPDATAAARIAPRRPGSAPSWAEQSTDTTRTSTVVVHDEEKTRVAMLRTRLAASKYISTTPSLPSVSPRGSPRASPRTSPRMSSSRLLVSADWDEHVPGPGSPVAVRRVTPPDLEAVTEEAEEGSPKPDSQLTTEEPVFGNGTRPGSLSLFRHSSTEQSAVEGDSPVTPTLVLPPKSPSLEPPATNTVAVTLAPHAQAVFDAHHEYAKSLEGEVKGYREILQQLKTDVMQRDAIIVKLMPVQDELKELREALLASRAENKELKAELNAQVDLKDHLLELEGANAELREDMKAAADQRQELTAKLEEAQYDLQVARDDMDATGIQASGLQGSTIGVSVSGREKDGASAGATAELKVKLEEAEYQLQAAIDEKDVALHEVGNVRKVVEELQGKLQAETNLRLDLEDHNDILSEKISKLNLQVEEKSAMLEDHKMALEDHKLALEDNKATLEAQTVDLEDHKAALDEHRVAIDEHRAEIEGQKTELDTRDEERAQLRAQLQKVKADLDAHKTEIDSLKAAAEAVAVTLPVPVPASKVLKEADSNRSPFYAVGTSPDAQHHLDQLKVKDMRIKSLERQVKRLNEDRELLSVAANSAQMQSELLKRRLGHLVHNGGTPGGIGVDATPRPGKPRLSSLMTPAGGASAANTPAPGRRVPQSARR